ncbi:MAG: hypothetical protein IJM02_06705 [Clostridia bacterium]|nr:hypothetical protein [Clostridia bacterium]
MGNIWDILNNILDAISAFINWYMNETPLFNDTLDSFYALGVQAYNLLYPLVGEYIYYISEYFSGVGA